MVIAFFIIAFVYSMVGFGGGSSYLAILALNNADYSIIPIVALICNLIVVSGSSYHYLKNKMVNLKLIFPLIITSAPMAFLGGLYRIEKNTFYILLIVCLLIVALRILFFSTIDVEETQLPERKKLYFYGCIIGLLSGIVGLGGGIILSPLLISKKWANAKQAASLSSLFILINSTTGLLGQLFKQNFNIQTIVPYAPLFLAVILGGQLGVYLSIKKANLKFVEKSTAILILFICINLLRGI